MILPTTLVRAIARGDVTLVIHPARYAHRRTGDLLRCTPAHQPIQATTDENTRASRAQPIIVNILNAKQRTLGHLDNTQAQAAGYSTTAEFETAFVERFDRDWIQRQRTYFLDHDIPEPDVDEAVSLLIPARYAHHWTTTRAWFLTITPAHVPLFLAPCRDPRRADEHGYTRSSSSAIDDAERIDVAQLAPAWNLSATARRTTARTEKHQRARNARQLLSLEQRMARARQAAQTNYIDVRDELKLLRKFIAEHRSERSIGLQLDRLEQRAYRETAA